MRNPYFLIFVLISGVSVAMPAMAAEAVSAEHQAVSLKPQMLVQIGGFGITNSMLVTWFVAAGIIFFSQIATRRVKRLPSGIQNLLEGLVECLANFFGEING